MRKNLFGELMFESKDIALNVYDSIVSQDSWILRPKPNSRRGIEVFNSHSKMKISKRGYFYVVYKYGDPLYVGMTRVSLRNRLSRMVSEILETTTDNESHPAGQKYRKEYGQNFDGLTVKFVPFDDKDWPVHISAEEVEIELIRKIRPRYNIEIYKSARIDSATLVLENPFIE